MKNTGIVRKLDELGRITLPIELRRTLGIEDREPLEIFVDGDTICLKAHREKCQHCDSTEDLVAFRGKDICRTCITLIKENL